MTIQEDSGKILLYVHDCYVNNRNKPNSKILFEETQWDGRRIDRVIKYLKDFWAIEIILTAGQMNGLQNFIFRKITPLGINIVENKPEFKRNFGFEVNIGLIPSLKLSWGVSEK